MPVIQGKCQYSKLLEPSEETKRFKSKYSIDLFVSDEALKTAASNASADETSVNTQ